MAAEAQRGQGLWNTSDVRGRTRRQAEVPLDRRPESRGHVAQSQADVRRDGEARDARGPGDLGDQDRGVLEAAGRGPEDHRHRSHPPARRILHGEERDHFELGGHGAGGEAARDEVLRKAPWAYTPAEDVLKEINGYAVRDNPETGLKKGDLIRKVSDLRADGSTSSGAWIYAGVFGNGENLSKRRDSVTDPGGLGLYPGFGWTWPNNMRILYNRASCDKNGQPYPTSKPIIWWDEKAKRWTGHDVPDVPVATDGPSTPNGQRAFHLSAEGVGRLFSAG